MKQKTRSALLAAGLIAAIPMGSFAQAPLQAQSIASSDVLSQISMYSYRDGPKSDLYFRGTPIAALAEGDVQVEYQDGNARISAKVDQLPAPASLGPYAVYVLWAVTPDGRAANQGVIAGSGGGKGKLDTEYGASQFALIVTAEPHFAVTAPSSMITLYNVADDVKGTETRVTTLTERSDYSDLTRQPANDATPTEIVQARYAYAIAGAAGAEQFAQQDYMQANAKLMAAETALEGSRSERRMAPQLGREAVVASEDTRRAAMIGSAAAATETQRLAAANAATSAANARAATARESTRAQTEADRQRAAATAEANRQQAAATAETNRQLAAANAETSRQQAAVNAASAARADLRSRLNGALPTHDSNRGLVAEIGGAQFATGQAELSVAAREGAAKFSGIVASYPELRFSVEGHTDNTGSVATNDALALRRANSVRSFLISQGVPAASIDVVGYGSSMPTADNTTVTGRARNRRVEIVVSGGLLASN